MEEKDNNKETTEKDINKNSNIVKEDPTIPEDVNSEIDNKSEVDNKADNEAVKEFNKTTPENEDTDNQFNNYTTSSEKDEKVDGTINPNPKELENDFILNALAGNLGNSIEDVKKGNFNFTLRSKEFYWNNPTIKKSFEAKYGEDAENKFDETYKQAVNSFYDFSLASYYEDTASNGTVSTKGTVFTPESRRGLFRLYKEDLGRTGGAFELPDGEISDKKFSIRKWQKTRVKLGDEYYDTEGKDLNDFVDDPNYANDEGKVIKSWSYSDDGLGMIPNYDGEDTDGRQVASRWDLSGLTDVQLEGSFLSCIPRSIISTSTSIISAGVDIIAGTVGLFAGDDAKHSSIVQSMNNAKGFLKTLNISQADSTLENGMASLEGAVGLITDVAAQLIIAKKFGGLLSKATGSREIASTGTRLMLTGMGVSDVTETAKKNKLSPRETALLLGASFYGMWKVNSLFNWYENKADARFIQKRLRNTILQEGENLSAMKGLMKEGGKNAERKFFDNVVNKIESVAKWGKENIQVGGYAATLKEGMIQEGMEEFSEYETQEFIQNSFNLLKRLGTGKSHKAGEGAFKDITDEGYLSDNIKNAVLNALGGFVGGAMGAPLMDWKGFIRDSKHRTPEQYDSLVTAVATGNKEELLDALESLRRDGKLGPKDISMDYDAASKRHKLMQETEDSPSMNDTMYQLLKMQIESIHSVVDSVGAIGSAENFRKAFPELAGAIEATSLSKDFDNNIKDYLEAFTNLNDEQINEVKSLTKKEDVTDKEIKALTEEQQKAYKALDNINTLYSGKAAEKYIKQAVSLAPHSMYVESVRKQMEKDQNKKVSFREAYEDIIKTPETLEKYRSKEMLSRASKKLTETYGADYFQKLDDLFFNIDRKNKIRFKKDQESAISNEEIINTLSDDLNNIEDIQNNLINNNVILLNDQKVKGNFLEKIDNVINSIDIKQELENSKELFNNIYDKDDNFKFSDETLELFYNNDDYGEIDKEELDKSLPIVLNKIYSKYYGDKLNSEYSTSELSSLKALSVDEVKDRLVDLLANHEAWIDTQDGEYTFLQVVADNSMFKADGETFRISDTAYDNIADEILEELNSADINDQIPFIGSGINETLDKSFEKLKETDKLNAIKESFEVKAKVLNEDDLILNPEDFLSSFDYSDNIFKKKTSFEQLMSIIREKNSDKGDIPSDYKDLDEVLNAKENLKVLTVYFEGLKTLPSLLYDFRKRIASDNDLDINSDKSFYSSMERFTDMYFDPVEYGRLNDFDKDQLTDQQKKYIDNIEDIFNQIDYLQNKAGDYFEELTVIEDDVNRRIEEGTVADPFNPNLISRTKNELELYSELLNYLNNNGWSEELTKSEILQAFILESSIDPFDLTSDNIKNKYGALLLDIKKDLFNIKSSEKDINSTVANFIGSIDENSKLYELKQKEGYDALLSNTLVPFNFDINDFYKRFKALSENYGAPTMDQQLAAQTISAFLNSGISEKMTFLASGEKNNTLRNVMFLSGIAGSGKSTFAAGSGLKIAQDIQNNELNYSDIKPQDRDNKMILVGNTIDQSNRLVETAKKYDINYKEGNQTWDELLLNMVESPETFSDVSTIVIDEATFVPYDSNSKKGSDKNALFSIVEAIDNINNNHKGDKPKIKLLLMGDPQQGGYTNPDNMIDNNIGVANNVFKSYFLNSSLRAYVDIIPTIAEKFKSKNLNPNTISSIDSVYGKAEFADGVTCLGGVQFDSQANISNDKELANSIKSMIDYKYSLNQADPKQELFSIAIISNTTDGLNCLTEGSEVRKVIEDAIKSGKAEIKIKNAIDIQGDEVDYAIIYADPGYSVISNEITKKDWSNSEAKKKAKELAVSITRARYLATVINDANLDIKPAELTSIKIKDPNLSNTLISAFSDTMSGVIGNIEQVEFDEFIPKEEEISTVNDLVEEEKEPEVLEELNTYKDELNEIISDKEKDPSTVSNEVDEKINDTEGIESKDPEVNKAIISEKEELKEDIKESSTNEENLPLEDDELSLENINDSESKTELVDNKEKVNLIEEYADLYKIDFKNLNIPKSLYEEDKKKDKADTDKKKQNSESRTILRLLDIMSKQKSLTEKEQDDFTEGFIKDSLEPQDYMDMLDKRGKLAIYTHTDRMIYSKEDPFIKKSNFKQYGSQKHMNALLKAIGYSKGSKGINFKDSELYLVAHKQDGKLYANITVVNKNDTFTLGALPMNSLKSNSTSIEFKNTIDTHTTSDGKPFIVKLEGLDGLIEHISKGAIKNLPPKNNRTANELIKDLKDKWGDNIQISDTIYVNYRKGDPHRGESFLLYSFNKNIDLKGKAGEEFFTEGRSFSGMDSKEYTYGDNEGLYKQQTFGNGVGIIYLSNKSLPYNQIYKDFFNLNKQQLSKYKDYVFNRKQELAAIEAIEAIVTDKRMPVNTDKFTVDKYSLKDKTVVPEKINRVIENLLEDNSGEDELAKEASIVTLNILINSVNSLGHLVEDEDTGLIETIKRKVIDSNVKRNGKLKYINKVVPQVSRDVYATPLDKYHFNYPISYVTTKNKNVKEGLEGTYEPMDYSFNIANFIRLTKVQLNKLSSEYNDTQINIITDKVLSNINDVFGVHEQFFNKSNNYTGISISLPVVNLKEGESRKDSVAVNAMPLPNLEATLNNVTTTAETINLPIVYLNSNEDGENALFNILKNSIDKGIVDIDSFKEKKDVKDKKTRKTPLKVINENKSTIFKSLEETDLEEDDIKKELEERINKILKTNNLRNISKSALDKLYSEFSEYNKKKSNSSTENIPIVITSLEDISAKTLKDTNKVVEFIATKDKIIDSDARFTIFSKIDKLIETFATNEDFINHSKEISQHIKNIYLAPNLYFLSQLKSPGQAVATTEDEKNLDAILNETMRIISDTRTEYITSNPSKVVTEALNPSGKNLEIDDELENAVLHDEKDIVKIVNYYKDYDIRGMDLNKAEYNGFLLNKLQLIPSKNWISKEIIEQEANSVISDDFNETLTNLNKYFNFIAGTDTQKLSMFLENAYYILNNINTALTETRVKDLLENVDSDVYNYNNFKSSTAAQVLNKVIQDIAKIKIDEVSLNSDISKIAPLLNNTDGNIQSLKELSDSEYEQLFNFDDYDSNVNNYKLYNLNRVDSSRAERLREHILNYLGVKYDSEVFKGLNLLEKIVLDNGFKLTSEMEKDMNTLTLSHRTGKSLDKYLKFLYSARNALSLSRTKKINTVEDYNEVLNELKLASSNVEQEFNSLPKILQQNENIIKMYNSRKTALQMAEKKTLKVDISPAEDLESIFKANNTLVKKSTLEALKKVNIDKAIFDYDQFEESIKEVIQKEDLQSVKQSDIGNSLNNLFYCDDELVEAGMTEDQIEELLDAIEAIEDNFNKIICKTI